MLFGEGPPVVLNGPHREARCCGALSDHAQSDGPHIDLENEQVCAEACQCD
jgi:hypothetical protein